MSRLLASFLGLRLWLKIGTFLIDAVMWLMIGLLFLCDWLTPRHGQQPKSAIWKKDATKRAGVK